MFLIFAFIFCLNCSYYRTQSGIYVHHVSSGSVAEECGCLQVGDRILEINGVDVRRASIDEAATLMAVSNNTS